MPNNPYDDLLKSLVKLLEQITSLEQNMRKMQNGVPTKPGIIGCAIITGGLTPPDHGPQTHGQQQKMGLTYEMVDAGTTAYLTVQLPPDLADEPFVEFDERKCNISTKGLTGSIDLQFPIIPETSTWTFCNGVLDVVLEKKRETASEAETQYQVHEDQ
jgi:hypothetical protein